MNSDLQARFHPTFSEMPRWRRLFSSIKGQIFIVFAVTLLSLIALTSLNFWSLSTIKVRLLLGERYYELFNDILEVRRFEKNFLLYRDKESLHEGTVYLRRIDDIASELASDIVRVTDQRSFETFVGSLVAYEQTLRDYEWYGDKFVDSEDIRQRGKSLVDFAEHLLRTKQKRIHKAISQTSLLPFAFLGSLLLLMLLVIMLISQGLLRPLGVLHSTIQRVAKGDYRPTSYEGLHTDEVSGLIRAFNLMAQELEANQEHLLQARKIAALGTFTAGIAHELNNPINNIYLTAETYMEEYEETMDEEAKEMMGDILAQAERAGDIVKNLLDFSRTERPSFVSLDPLEIVHSTVALLKNQLSLAGIKLQSEFREGLPHVRGNLRNMQQVFMNLLLNSMQAMPDGGVLCVAVKTDSQDHVRFDIQDTGSGIPPEVLDHIFEPFYTTKGVGRGTGLGLAVVYSIVQRHGGRIEVKSEPGKGTTFSVILPTAREATNTAGD